MRCDAVIPALVMCCRQLLVSCEFQCGGCGCCIVLCIERTTCSSSSTATGARGNVSFGLLITAWATAPYRPYKISSTQAQTVPKQMNLGECLSTPCRRVR
jgi:hypothetical protein